MRWDGVVPSGAKATYGLSGDCASPDGRAGFEVRNVRAPTQRERRRGVTAPAGARVAAAQHRRLAPGAFASSAVWLDSGNAPEPDQARAGGVRRGRGRPNGLSVRVLGEAL